MGGREKNAARCALQVLDRGAQVNARGATHALGGGVQAVARGAARYALHVHGRGCSFAVLSAQASTVDLRLRLCQERCLLP